MRPRRVIDLGYRTVIRQPSTSSIIYDLLALLKNQIDHATSPGNGQATKSLSDSDHWLVLNIMKLTSAIRCPNTFCPEYKAFMVNVSKT